MDLIRIEGSSNVAAIGYLPEFHFLRVKFHDGRQYDWAGISAERYAALMEAPSKGKHLAANFPSGVRCVGDADEVRLREPYVDPVSAPEPKPLETFTPDDCCQSRLMKADRSNLRQFVCPKCGCEWEWKMIDGIRHWHPVDTIMVW